MMERRDGWGQNRGGDRDGDRGQHNGWARGEHSGWDGNRPPGIERRDARDDQRIHNGIRDGSLTPWANGGTRGQAQARPEAQPQPQAPTIRQAAFQSAYPSADDDGGGDPDPHHEQRRSERSGGRR